MEVSCSSHQCAEVIGVCRPVQPVVVYKKLKSINLYISLFRLDLFHFVVKDKSHEMFSVPSENAATMTSVQILQPWHYIVNSRIHTNGRPRRPQHRSDEYDNTSTRPPDDQLLRMFFSFLFDIQELTWGFAFRQPQKLKQLALCSAKVVRKLPNSTEVFSSAVLVKNVFVEYSIALRVDQDP